MSIEITITENSEVHQQFIIDDLDDEGLSDVESLIENAMANEGYAMCDGCGRYFTDDDMLSEVEGTTDMICDHCAREGGYDFPEA
jgi:hypothetical protein